MKEKLQSTIRYKTLWQNVDRNLFIELVCNFKEYIFIKQSQKKYCIGDFINITTKRNIEMLQVDKYLNNTIFVINV